MRWAFSPLSGLCRAAASMARQPSWPASPRAERPRAAADGQAAVPAVGAAAGAVVDV
jgi:hypothetical protein